ncbi:LysR family transcriptional regulator [Caldimonas thermodepolymerans]|uniref:LysR family transcriptional regulator n=1 Tax=Caldimonas thermodepolymerans TaxID=215580 RepID=UPI000E2D962B|nr:LysR family transcriptional regulator [Caldimonas thermodepolymerans]QPC32073.1 LysR family transcriptional regulator [Caldimonas thermodepolymerans]RDH95914.1 LysR family transcriptional regulator [Caldimonas thermodepolymerans]
MHMAQVMLSELRTFVLLAELGSAQEVARRLPLTQPAVTRQLQRLEALLDAQLLDRRSKPARLTPTGVAVLAEARKVLAAVEELKQVASQSAEPKGVLRLGLAHALCEPALADGLHELGRRHPAVRLQLASGWSSELLARVDRGELDAAVIHLAGAADAMPPPRGQVLAEDDLVFLVSPQLPLPARPRLEALNRIGWVLTPDTVCGSRGALRAAVERSGVALHVAAEVQDAALQAGLVQRGLGVGVMPRRRAEAWSRMKLRRVSVPGLRLRMTVSLVRALHLGRLARAVDTLEAVLKERLRRQGRRQ